MDVAYIYSSVSLSLVHSPLRSQLLHFSLICCWTPLYNGPMMWLKLSENCSKIQTAHSTSDIIRSEKPWRVKDGNYATDIWNTFFIVACLQQKCEEMVWLCPSWLLSCTIWNVEHTTDWIDIDLLIWLKVKGQNVLIWWSYIRRF